MYREGVLQKRESLAVQLWVCLIVNVCREDELASVLNQRLDCLNTSNKNTNRCRSTVSETYNHLICFERKIKLLHFHDCFKQQKKVGSIHRVGHEMDDDLLNMLYTAIAGHASD